MSYVNLRFEIEKHLHEVGLDEGVYQVLLATGGIVHDQCHTIVNYEFKGESLSMVLLEPEEKRKYDMFCKINSFVTEFLTKFNIKI